MVGGESPDWLPQGFDVKVKYMDGKKIKYYLNVATGAKYRTKKDVIKSATENNKVHGTLATEQAVNGLSSGDKVKDVDNPSPDTPQDTSKTRNGSTSKKKQKAKTFKTIDVESTVDDDLPPGWIKEIKISKSGDNKIRKDPFYIDPITAYVFRSKKDVLRYLETNDITKCAIRPLKRELCDLKKNDIPSSNPATEKSQDYKNELSIREESIDGRETSATKSLAESEANVEHTPDATICSPVFDPSPIKQEEKQPDKTRVVTRSKKRKGSTLPSRSSKRLAGHEPEMQSDVHINERNGGAAVRPSVSDVDPFPSLKEGVHPTPNVEPENETADAHISEEPLRETEPVDKTEMPISEKPAAVGDQDQAAAEEQLDVSEDKSQEPNFFSGFGESWFDPTLEFAIKTLRGEIPIEETLKFTSCFTEPLNHNLCSGGLKSNASINFQNEFLPCSEYSKQPGSINHMPVTQMPSSSMSFTAPGNVSFSTSNVSNGQSSADTGEKGLLRKP